MALDERDRRDALSRWAFCHNSPQCASFFEKVPTDEGNFKLKMVGGDDPAQWNGEAWVPFEVVLGNQD